VGSTYADAAATAEELVIDGVRVPFVGLETPIKSKSTYREQDRANLVKLLDLLVRKAQPADSVNGAGTSRSASESVPNRRSQSSNIHIYVPGLTSGSFTNPQSATRA